METAKASMASPTAMPMRVRAFTGPYARRSPALAARF
jgi:hypothetical protein